MTALHSRRVAFVSVIALATGLVATPVAHASPVQTDRYVALSPPATGGGSCAAPDYNTIAAAVAAASAGDTIHICAGTYVLGASVDVTKDLAFVGAGVGTTIVDGGSSVRLFNGPGRTLTFSHLTFENGVAGAGNGGAISAARVTVSHTLFSTNTAAGGGAIYTVAGVGSPAVSVTDSTFFENGGQATVGGGAIYAQGGAVSVAGTLFLGNAALGTNDPVLPTDGAGGAILAASIDVSHSTFIDGWAALHGGALLADTITVSDSMFDTNRVAGVDATPGYGGAIWGGTVTATDSTFMLNEAAGGGAIGVSGGGSAAVSGSTFDRNGDADTFGGAIYATGGAVVAANSTFSGNLGFLGGAAMAGTTITATNVTFAGNGGPASFGAAILASGGTLTNTIVAGTVGNADCWAPGTFTDGGGNFSTDAGCGWTQPSSHVVTAAQLALGGLADDGGPTQTIALGAASVAIDAGIDAVCAAPPVDGVDQRGIARPQGIHCDSGAYEYVFPSLDVTGFSPGAGPIGTVVTINGSGFERISRVAFAGKSAAFTVISPTRIRATVPVGATTGPITVTGSGGSDVSDQSFTVVLAPALLSFSPASGRVGSLVTITGVNLAYTRSVTIGGVAAAFSVRNPTTVVATVPARAVTGRIVVSSPFGSATSIGSFYVLP